MKNFVPCQTLSLCDLDFIDEVKTPAISDWSLDYVCHSCLLPSVPFFGD